MSLLNDLCFDVLLDLNDALRINSQFQPKKAFAIEVELMLY